MPDDAERRVLAELLESLGVTQEIPRISREEIASAAGDQELLLLFEKAEEYRGERTLSSEGDSIIQRLSFTHRALEPSERPTAWEDFLREQGMSMGLLQTWAIGVWYRDRGLLDQAASVYEVMDREAHRDHCGLGYDYLLEMMKVYAELGDPGRVRDLFADVKRAFAEEDVDTDFVDEARSLLAGSMATTSADLAEPDLRSHYAELQAAFSATQGELTNTRFDLERLKAGINLDERRLVAQEWLGRYQGALMGKLCVEAKTALIDLQVILNSPLQERLFWCIPVACQKAVEAEFDCKIWRPLRSQLPPNFLPDRYRKELSVNQIYELLTAAAREPFLKQLQQEIRRRIQDLKIASDLFEDSYVRPLALLKAHSTDARHGKREKRAYTKARLCTFIESVGCRAQDGWLYKFLCCLHARA